MTNDEYRRLTAIALEFARKAGEPSWWSQKAELSRAARDVAATAESLASASVLMARTGMVELR